MMYSLSGARSATSIRVGARDGKCTSTGTACNGTTKTFNNDRHSSENKTYRLLMAIPTKQQRIQWLRY